MSPGSPTSLIRKSSASPEEFAMQKITPFLWFDNQAEEAAKFYVSVFSAKEEMTRRS
jgi:3-demethylubiquinone-9 3-methyltransferase